MVMITLYAKQKKRLLDSVGEGEGGMFQENSIHFLPFFFFKDKFSLMCIEAKRFCFSNIGICSKPFRLKLLASVSHI